ncbi:hypothetical protein Zmor_006539 [Zophobas morio]|uniref:Mitochondrial cardiolipin hydrolase n=2 Tax=Zophobas morio TaxID=2755281 RepID=A0AA38MNN5_9CUCU|nr:hypothetical protein Zmor_006539 [Zophobas morio]
MCMYHLTLKQVADELIKAQRRGITVRIITDYITSRIEHSKMKLLKNTHGFDVRTPPCNDSFMHHKYCLIDAEDADLQKLFLGSLNLTLQGCVANFEFVVITNNPHMIREYSKEFNVLWNTFEESNVLRL